jgi:PAS domain S-box-containing protein
MVKGVNEKRVREAPRGAGGVKRRNHDRQTKRAPNQLKTQVRRYKEMEASLRETFRRLEIAYDQSIMYAEHLNEEIGKRKHAEAALRTLEEDYRRLVQNSLTGIYIVQDGKIVHANDRFSEIFGYAKDALMGMESLQLIHSDDKALVARMRTKPLKGEEIPPQYEARGVTRNGKTIWVVGKETHIEHQGRPAILGNVDDITELRRAADALHEKGEALKAHARKLEELTTALRVLLERREEDKTHLEEKVVSNVKKRIFPYIDALKKTRLGISQKTYTSIIESNLQDIVSPFLRELASEYPDLTSKEIQVANLIREGKTSKEIADLLHVSASAVDFHRKNLRRKLDLTKRRSSLRGYLLSVE